MTVTKIKTGMSLDSDILDKIERDRGTIPVSTYINHLLMIFYSETHGYWDEMQALINDVGFKGTLPDFIRQRIQKYIRADLVEQGLL